MHADSVRAYHQAVVCQTVEPHVCFGYLVTIQLHKCVHFVFCIKNIQNFVDLDACKQLFVLNSYKSAIKKKRK